MGMSASSISISSNAALQERRETGYLDNLFSLNLRTLSSRRLAIESSKTLNLFLFKSRLFNDCRLTREFKGRNSISFEAIRRSSSVLPTRLGLGSVVLGLRCSSVPFVSSDRKSLTVAPQKHCGLSLASSNELTPLRLRPLT